MRLPHEIEVGEIVGLRHWRPSTLDVIDSKRIEPCVAYATNPDEPTKIMECTYRTVREIRLTSGTTVNMLIWPTGGLLEAKCITEMKLSTLKASWCARRGHGPAPCTMDRPFVCMNGYSGSQCGIYAWNTRGVHERSIADDIWETVRASTPYVVWGLVALSGRVAEHEEGYRAEFARPIALLSPDCKGPWQGWTKKNRHEDILDLYKVERYSDIEGLLLGLLLYEKERKKKGRK